MSHSKKNKFETHKTCPPIEHLTLFLRELVCFNFVLKQKEKKKTRIFLLAIFLSISALKKILDSKVRKK